MSIKDHWVEANSIHEDSMKDIEEELNETIEKLHDLNDTESTPDGEYDIFVESQGKDGRECTLIGTVSDKIKAFEICEMIALAVHCLDQKSILEVKIVGKTGEDEGLVLYEGYADGGISVLM